MYSLFSFHKHTWSSGLFYDAISNDIGAEMAYLEANKLNVAQARALLEAEMEKEKKEKEKLKEKEQEGKADIVLDEEGEKGSKQNSFYVKCSVCMLSECIQIVFMISVICSSHLNNVIVI